MGRPYDILQSILSDPSIFLDNKKGLTLEDYISDESILAIEHNIDFFKDIPKDDIQTVLEDFITIVYDYEVDIGRYESNFEVLLKPFVSHISSQQINHKSTQKIINKIEMKRKKSLLN